MVKQFTRTVLAVATALWVSGALAENHGHHHQALPKDVDTFHALLAPVWHARPGMERSRNACAQAAAMEKSARDIRSSDATKLVASVAALKAKCEGNLADVDAALYDVHEAFHALIEARPPAATR